MVLDKIMVGYGQNDIRQNNGTDKMVLDKIMVRTNGTDKIRNKSHFL